MSRSVVVKVSFQAVESELIDSKIEDLRNGRIGGLNFLSSEIPGFPEFQFKDAVTVSWGSETGRQRFLQRILDKACVAVIGEPKDLILIIEDIPQKEMLSKFKN